MWRVGWPVEAVVDADVRTRRQEVDGYGLLRSWVRRRSKVSAIRTTRKPRIARGMAQTMPKRTLADSASSKAPLATTTAAMPATAATPRKRKRLVMEWRGPDTQAASRGVARIAANAP